LAKVFAWVRPNDLVWNYVVSNYLMGENPPAFDILAWNADVTNLPAALHAEFVQLFTDNLLLQPGGITVLGTPVDLGTITTDVYMLAAINDHLVPWQAVYEGTQAFGGDVRFVLSNSGHIAALINPPDNPKASYLVGEDQPSDPALWLKSAERTAGSWWTDWTDWVLPRSGGRRPKPRKLGNRNHPIIEPAPGRYVTER
jgi:polyhydroxyalkanoate synthase